MIRYTWYFFYSNIILICILEYLYDSDDEEEEDYLAASQKTICSDAFDFLFDSRNLNPEKIEVCICIPWFFPLLPHRLDIWLRIPLPHVECKINKVDLQHLILKLTQNLQTYLPTYSKINLTTSEKNKSIWTIIIKAVFQKKILNVFV